MSKEVELVTRNQATGVKSYSDGSQYKTIAAGQTNAVIGVSGAQGDYLKALVCVVATPATSSVDIKDGATGSAISVLPAAVAGAIGTYTIPLGLTAVAAASGGWRITTGAGVSVIAIGRFT